MPHLTANDFHPEVLKLFDQYVHSRITRDEFVSGAEKYTRGNETGESLLDSLRPRFAESRQVQPSDPRIETSFLTVESPAGHGWVRNYLVKPANLTGRVPGILVAHENRGL